MIDVYLNQDDIESKEQDIRGFPIINEKQRKTAISWAKTEEYIQIPDVISGLEIVGLVDRLKNKIFKLRYNTVIKKKKYSILFDMYTYEMLDVMQNSSIVNSVIQGEIVFLDRARLALKDGSYHKEWLEKQQLKRIPASELQFGHVYKTTPNGSEYIYLGRKDKNFVSLDCLIYNNGKIDTDWDWYDRTNKTVSYTIDTGIIVPKEDIIELLRNSVKKYHGFLYGYEQRMREDYRRANYWKEEIDRCLKILDHLKSFYEFLGIERN